MYIRYYKGRAFVKASLLLAAIENPRLIARRGLPRGRYRDLSAFFVVGVNEGAAPNVDRR